MNSTSYAPAGDPRALAPLVKDPTLAVLLELLPGIFFQTFGIGNIYAGNVLLGIALMLGYWFSCLVNLALCFVLIGFVTWPLTFVAFSVAGSLLAHSRAQATRRFAG